MNEERLLAKINRRCARKNVAPNMNILIKKVNGILSLIIGGRFIMQLSDEEGEYVRKLIRKIPIQKARQNQTQTRKNLDS